MPNERYTGESRSYLRRPFLDKAHQTLVTERALPRVQLDEVIRRSCNLFADMAELSSWLCVRHEDLEP